MNEINLTPRTRIEWRYTTNPADFGYDGQESGWRDMSADEIGSPRTILQRAYERLRMMGCIQGTYYAEEFRLAKLNGTAIPRRVIEEYVDDMDCRHDSR